MSSYIVYPEMIWSILITGFWIAIYLLKISIKIETKTKTEKTKTSGR